MKKISFLAGGALVAAGLLAYNVMNSSEKITLENNMVKTEFEIPAARPIHYLTKTDSLRYLDYAYGFNEKDLEKYNSWIDSTLEESRINKSYAIIVNKSQYKLSIVKDGKKIKDYSIELGFDPIGDKQYEGDRRTPEGMYLIENKFSRGETRFHKALLISYPDKNDQKEYAKLMKEEKIPFGVGIGGLIEIHGSGSGLEGGTGFNEYFKKPFYGQNWTHGCMALSNQQIDEFFGIIPKGSRATIVKYTDKF